MKNLSVIFILLSLVALQACVKGCEGVPGKNWTTGASQLKYDGEQSIDEEFRATELSIESGVADIDLKGEAGTHIRLRIIYREYKPGDAIISIENGVLKAESKSGKHVQLMAITGTIPQNLNLDIENGTGAVLLSNLGKAAMLQIETGTGKVNLRNTQVGSIKFESGTGSVDLDKCLIDKAEITTGTGSINLNDCYIETADVESGTGNLNLKNSTIAHPDFESGTGKLYQEGKYQISSTDKIGVIH